MIITTTNCVEGYHITEYLSTVNTNICVGANIFTDIAASWTDIFSDRSSQYQEKLDKMYQAAVKEINDKAKNLNADAVVGLQMNFGSVNISSASRTVFMLSASGTAVKLSAMYNGRYDMYQLLHDIKSYLNEGIISQEDYDIEVKRIRADFEANVKKDKENFITKLHEKEEYEKKYKSELQLIHNREHKEELISKGVKILKSLNLSNGSDADILYITGLSETNITDSSYDDTNVDGSSMYKDIKELIGMSRYAEACKIYIENTGLDVDDAKEYVVSVYRQCTLSDDSALRQLSTKLANLLLENHHEEAIKALVDAIKMKEYEANNILYKILR